MPSYQLSPALPQGDVIVGDPTNRQRDSVLLGKMVEAGPTKSLRLDISGEQVVAIFGKRGTGKSYTLGVLVEGLAAGRGQTPIASLNTPRAGLVLDIMDIYWTSTVPLFDGGSAEIKKQFEIMRKGGFKSQDLAVDCWIPAGYENSEIDPPNLQSLTIQARDLEIDDWASLFSVDIYGEPRGMLIADLVAYLGRDGYQTSSGTVLPKEDYTFQDALLCLDNSSDIQTNYRPDTIRSIRQRLASYALLPLFQGTGTPLKDLLKVYRVSVLMLARLPDELKRVVVSVLVRRLLRNRRDASFAQKRLDLDPRLVGSERTEMERYVQESVPRSWIFLDEAHVLAGSGQASVASEALIKYAKEGRNYGLSLAVATQQPSALDPRLTSQAETLIVHQLTAPADAAIATQNLRSPRPDEIRIDGSASDFESCLRRLGQGEMAFSCGNAPSLPRVCIAAVRPRISAHGGYEA